MITKKKGDKNHKPTDKTKHQVSALYSFGHTQEEIALFLNICADTLAKHYKRELETARIEANAAVANKLYRKATEGDDLSAQIFWLKTRGRWRTADKVAETESQDRISRELSEVNKNLLEKNKRDH
jgi:hypothetical protein